MIDKASKTQCQKILKKQGKAYPRTCPVCFPGECHFVSEIDVDTEYVIKEEGDLVKVYKLKLIGAFPDNSNAQMFVDMMQKSKNDP